MRLRAYTWGRGCRAAAIRAPLRPPVSRQGPPLRRSPALGRRPGRTTGPRTARSAQQPTGQSHRVLSPQPVPPLPLAGRRWGRGRPPGPVPPGRGCARPPRRGSAGQAGTAAPDPAMQKGRARKARPLAVPNGRLSRRGGRSRPRRAGRPCRRWPPRPHRRTARRSRTRPPQLPRPRPPGSSCPRPAAPPPRSTAPRSP